jgi:endogenous inhibitor of DNA gyrase (YacG/DUF329 family)
MTAKLEDLAEHRELRRRESGPPARGVAGPGKSARRCPICGAVAAGRYRPFCSPRCADIDLARWLNESYSVPGDPATGPVDSDQSEPE